MRTCSIVICLALSLALSFPKISQAQLIEGLVNIEFKPDIRVFAVMTAINAAGFDLDAGSLTENPARKAARDRLARLNPDLRRRLNNYYQAHNVEFDHLKQQSKYISYALLLEGPPEFRLTVRPEDLPPDAHSLVGFEAFLRELWGEEDIRRLWDDLRPHYLQEVEIYRPLIKGMILDTLRYLRTDARVALDRKVLFSPDLLNGYGVVNARNVDRNYILLVGPSRTNPRPTRAIRHEYLHFLIDPLIAKYHGKLPEPDPFLNVVRNLPQSLPRYKTDFGLIVTESLIQTVELRLDKKPTQERTSNLTLLYDQGLILAPYFDEGLDQFQQLHEAFQEFLPTLLDGMGWEKEKGRPERMARLRSAIAADQAKNHAEEEARSKVTAEVQDLLRRANELLVAKRAAEAKATLEQVLKLEPDNANAFFGLAQLAAQDQSFSEALEFYQQAAARSGADTWIKAWSLVRRGNIFRFQGDIVQARREWEQVRDVPGNLRGAAEAAAEALAETRP